MQVVYQKILKILGKTVNMVIPKRKNTIYVLPHENCKGDNYDLINSNSDNVLKIINYFIKNYRGNKVTIYLEYFDLSRKSILENYVVSIGNKCVKLVLIESCWNRDDGRSFINIIRYLSNSFIRYTCKVWICDTGWSRFWDNTKAQILINYNYCTPFKRGGIKDHGLSFNYIDYICQTSLMCAKVVSAEYEVYMDKFSLIGFARNDTLLNTDKFNAVKSWLVKKNIDGKKIIIYVPTYRPELVDFSELNIFGFRRNDSLDKLLKLHNAVIVTKLHPLQRKYVARLPNGCVSLEPTYDFSVYDLMSLCSVMVSDYSSIATDFLITKRPVIYLFSDIAKYDSDRGFSFEPIQSVCCGDVVYDDNQLLESLDKALNDPIGYVSPYLEKLHMWHKHLDSNSTIRAYELLCSKIN